MIIHFFLSIHDPSSNSLLLFWLCLNKGYSFTNSSNSSPLPKQPVNTDSLQQHESTTWQFPFPSPPPFFTNDQISLVTKHFPEKGYARCWRTCPINTLIFRACLAILRIGFSCSWDAHHRLATSPRFPVFANSHVLPLRDGRLANTSHRVAWRYNKAWCYHLLSKRKRFRRWRCGKS